MLASIEFGKRHNLGFFFAKLGIECVGYKIRRNYRLPMRGMFQIIYMFCWRS